MPELPDIEGLDQLLTYVEYVVIGLFAVLAWRGLGHVRRYWHEYRWQRRIARDPLVFEHEQLAYEQAVEVSEEEANAPGTTEIILGLSAQVAGLVAAFALGIYLGIDWHNVLFFGGFALVAASWLWKKLHAEPSREIFDPDAASDEDVIPAEAIMGFAAAAATVALFGLLVFSM